MGDENRNISSDEVPNSFIEWLLAMGCPAEKVPSLDSSKQMCRGQYYIVWRRLMEEVEPRSLIRHKRLKVFCDDLCKINDKNGVENKASLIEPDEMLLWREQIDLKEKVADTESRITQAKENLNHLVDKVSSKLSNRNKSIRHTSDIDRRVLLLHKVTEYLQAKKEDLQETLNIANAMSYTERHMETENKLDKCISVLRRQNRLPPSSQSILSAANPVACSSLASTNSEVDHEDNIASLVKCRGDALWPQLYERRAGLCVALSQACVPQPPTNADKMTPKSALAQTAALHCSIALEAMKNKAHIRQTQKLLASAITQLNDYLNGDACEYLVLNCERIGAQSRVNVLRGLLEEIVSREGVFECGARHTGDKHGIRRQISTVDKAILSTKEELKRLLQTVADTERKIFNVKQCLESVFGSLQNGGKLNEMDRFRGQMSLPQESIATMQQFYGERRTRQKNMDMSLDLELSANNSFIDCTDNAYPRFLDEFRMYLDRFSLEKNRKLVLECGEKIWIFETVQSSLDRIRSSWQTEELCCSLLCPSVSLTRNLQRLSNEIQRRNELEAVVQSLDYCDKEYNIDIDISSITVEENEIVDKIKKRLNENLITLQRISLTLDLGLDDMEFWISNTMKEYINSNRTINGKTYKEYEILYLRSLKL